MPLTGWPQPAFCTGSQREELATPQCLVERFIVSVGGDGFEIALAHVRQCDITGEDVAMWRCISAQGGYRRGRQIRLPIKGATNECKPGVGGQIGFGLLYNELPHEGHQMGDGRKRLMIPSNHFFYKKILVELQPMDSGGDFKRAVFDAGVGECWRELRQVVIRAA